MIEKSLDISSKLRRSEHEKSTSGKVQFIDTVP